MKQINPFSGKKLDSLYLVFGAEFLLIEQSLEQIRAAAKTQGFDERISFEVDGKFDWGQVIAQISTASLFSPKRIIECQLKTGKIGLTGSKSLTKIAISLPIDVLLIVHTGKLDLNQQKSKWFKTLQNKGKVIQHFQVKAENLVGWIVNHMTNLGLQSNTEVAQNIAFCTEGNLLASMQEIQKLKMAYPDGKIDVKAYQTQIKQQSKYTLYGLIDAALSGNSQQTLKIYKTLINDKSMPILLGYSLYQELNKLIQMSIELQKQPINTVLQNHRIWASRRPIISSALKRLSYQNLQKLLLLLGRIDRSIKGLDNLIVEDGYQTLLLTLTGKHQWTQ